MDNSKSNVPIKELEELIQALDSTAPTIDENTTQSVIYRTIDEDVNDDSDKSYDDLQDQINDLADSSDYSIPEAQYFSRLESIVPIAAVDCGIIRLGETQNGLIIALRATLVIDNGHDSKIEIFRTGPIYLHNIHKTKILHLMGIHLGQPDFFVELSNSEIDPPKPIKIKSGVADDAHQYGDRFRNWFERLIQKIAVSSINNGIILLDGALTLRTRDTPSSFLKDLVRTANRNGNSVLAISKQSKLQIGGKSIRFWLSDIPQTPSYRWLSPILDSEGSKRILGNLYAMRFTPLGPTLRVDVNAADGFLNDEIINDFYSASLMRGGYPDILVRAHTHSYFTSPDVMQLQAQAGAMYKLAPQPEVELTSIFAPFGGRFK